MRSDVPEGWEYCQLGHTLESIRGGGTPSRDNPAYWGGTIPWASVKDLTGPILHETQECITPEGVKASATNVISAGTVIVATRMAVGKAVRFSRDVAVNQDLKALIPTSKIQNGFLHSWMRAKESEIAAKATGSTVKGIRLSGLTELPMLLPPLAEQRKIAAILTSVDEAIQATEAVIAQTHRVKEGLLQELLTKGIGHTRFKQTEIGEIPEGWEVKICDEIATHISVGIVVKPTQYYAEKGVKCWRSANIGPGFVRDADWVFISEEANQLLSKSRLNEGDIVIVRTGYPGTACVVPKSLDQTNCIDTLFMRVNRDIIIPEFLCWFINSDVGKRQVLQGQGGLAQQHFNVKELRRVVLGLPSMDEQKDIVRHIDEVNESERTGSTHLQYLQRLKSGLLQDLLTGRVRVKGG